MKTKNKNLSFQTAVQGVYEYSSIEFITSLRFFILSLLLSYLEQLIFRMWTSDYTSTSISTYKCRPVKRLCSFNVNVTADRSGKKCRSLIHYGVAATISINFNGYSGNVVVTRSKHTSGITRRNLHDPRHRLAELSPGASTKELTESTEV